MGLILAHLERAAQLERMQEVQHICYDTARAGVSASTAQRNSQHKLAASEAGCAAVSRCIGGPAAALGWFITACYHQHLLLIINEQLGCSHLALGCCGSPLALSTMHCLLMYVLLLLSTKLLGCAPAGIPGAVVIPAYEGTYCWYLC
jgi:hypothetical protein